MLGSAPPSLWSTGLPGTSCPGWGCALMAPSLVTPHTPVCRVNFSASLCCYLCVGFQGWKESSEWSLCLA